MAGLCILRCGSLKMQTVKGLHLRYQSQACTFGTVAATGDQHRLLRHGRIFSALSPSARCSSCSSRRRLGPGSCMRKGLVTEHIFPEKNVLLHFRCHGVLVAPRCDSGQVESKCQSTGSSDKSDDEQALSSVSGAVGNQDYVVINFYHFVELQEPQMEVARHSAFIQEREVRGRIYINHQGINAQLSGPSKDAVAYADWVKEDIRFAGMYVQISPSPKGHAFPRLKLRYKPSLVQVEGGTACLPINEPAARAVPLTPTEWLEKLENSALWNGEGVDIEHANRRKALLLDVRNGYEWDVGHFKGTQRPEVDCFKDTEFGLSDGETQACDPLLGVDKETVDVMMYCTGGIRCDVYSTILRQRGFKNLFTLKGGVARYLKEDQSNWVGNLFVFDSRLAVPPRWYRGGEASSDEVSASSSSEEESARCRLCEGPLPEARHRNCANVDCNELFLSCGECEARQKGCCSISCAASSKLRPLLDAAQYERWHNYRECEPIPTRPPGFESRRAMRRRLRRENRKEQVSLTVECHGLHVGLVSATSS